MRSLPTRWPAVAILSTGLAVLLVLTGVVFLRSVGAVALILVIPGYTVLRFLGSDGSGTRFPERGAWIALTSMATTVLGGLLLNLMGSLTRTNWLLALSVFVVVLCLMQAGRTARHPIPPMDGHEEHSAPAPLTTRPARTDRKVFFRVATTAALVVVLFGITVAMSVISAHDTRERFTQLWLIPVHRVGGSQAELVEVGLKNFEGHATRYDLSIKRSPGAGLQHEQVTLGTNQQWTAVLTKPENQEILVTLHLATTPVQRDQFVMLPAKTEKAPLATPAQAQALPTSSSVPTARQLTMVRASP